MEYLMAETPLEKQPGIETSDSELSPDLVYKLRRTVEQEYGPKVGALLTEALDETQRNQTLVSCIQANTAMVQSMTQTMNPLLAQSNVALQTLADAELLGAQTEAARQVMWSRALGKEGILAAVITAVVTLGGVYLAAGGDSPLALPAAPIAAIEAAAIRSE